MEEDMKLRLFTTDDLVNIFGVRRQTVYNWHRKGLIRGRRKYGKGKRLFFLTTDVLNLIDYVYRVKE